MMMAIQALEMDVLVIVVMNVIQVNIEPDDLVFHAQMGRCHDILAQQLVHPVLLVPKQMIRKPHVSLVMLVVMVVVVSV